MNLVEKVKTFLADYPIKDNRFKLITIIASICFVLDQLTKSLVLSSFKLYESIVIIPNFFNLTYIRNYGAAFGFLNDPSIDWQFWLFVVFTILAICMILFLTRTSPYNKLLFICYAFILGGALGNFLDRLLFHSVTDFLHFYIGNCHWPAFNIADITIVLGTIGAMIIMYTMQESDIISENTKNIEDNK